MNFWVQSVKGNLNWSNQFVNQLNRLGSPDQGPIEDAKKSSLLVTSVLSVEVFGSPD